MQQRENNAIFNAEKSLKKEKNIDKRPHKVEFDTSNHVSFLTNITDVCPHPYKFPLTLISVTAVSRLLRSHCPRPPLTLMP